MEDAESNRSTVNRGFLSFVNKYVCFPSEFCCAMLIHVMSCSVMYCAMHDICVLFSSRSRSGQMVFLQEFSFSFFILLL